MVESLVPSALAVSMMVSKMKTVDKIQCKYLKNSPTPVNGEIVRGENSEQDTSTGTWRIGHPCTPSCPSKFIPLGRLLWGGGAIISTEPLGLSEFEGVSGILLKC